ncbi:MAG: HD domain-containing protein [Clostridium sp.]|nr:HD domain-containing protein [Clostridium sp.]
MNNIKKETVAALDLGANFFRMVVAEISSDGKIQILDELQKNTSIGSDTFSKKRIGFEAIGEACSILNGFVRLMRDYKVNFYWAVSTSGIREAENKEYVLEQIRVKTGIQIEVINTAQERFLVFKALRKNLKNSERIYNEGAMILNIGSGGVEVSVYDKGKLQFTEYIKIGSLRLIEILGCLKNSTLNFPSVMEEFVKNKTYTLVDYIKSYGIKNLIGLGGSFKFLLKNFDNYEKGFIPKKLILDFSKEIKSMSVDNVCEKFNINGKEAKLLMPSSVIMETFLNMTDAKGVYVPKVSLRHGMLIDMLSNKLNPENKKIFEDDIISTVWHIGEKYRIDKEHAKEVENLALFIFDKTQKIHRLKQRERTLLTIASILHDIGKFVNLNEKGLFCYTLIHDEEILGISNKNLNIIANVVRYHGEDMPSFSDENYKNLSYSDKLTVSKLAAILKLSESLKFSPLAKLEILDITSDDTNVYFKIKSNKDITIEQWLFNSNRELFEEVIGLKPIISIIN